MVWQRRGLELVKVTLSWQGHSDHNPAGNLELYRKCSEERGGGCRVHLSATDTTLLGPPCPRSCGLLGACGHPWSSRA